MKIMSIFAFSVYFIASLILLIASFSTTLAQPYNPFLGFVFMVVSIVLMFGAFYNYESFKS